MNSFRFSSLPISEWWAVVQEVPSATIFQTPLWFELWESYNGMKFVCDQFIFQNNFRVLVPRSFRSSSSQMISWCTYKGYGGYLSALRPTLEQLKAIAEYYMKTFPALKFTSNPIDNSWDDAFPWTARELTMIVDLQDFEQYQTMVRKSTLQRAKKLVDEGFVIRQTTDESHWCDFFNVYKENLDRWEIVKTPYKENLFRILPSVLRNSARLWGAFEEEKLVAGLVTLSFNKHMLLWITGCRLSYYAKSPLNALFLHVIKQAFQRGVSFVDLGLTRTSGGGYDWKLGFRPRIVTVNRYTQGARSFKSLRESHEI